MYYSLPLILFYWKVTCCDMYLMWQCCCLQLQIQKACQSLKRGYIERNNKAREVNCRNHRQRRGERSQGSARSNANNNRKCWVQLFTMISTQDQATSEVLSHYTKCNTTTNDNNKHTVIHTHSNPIQQQYNIGC